MWLLFSLLLAGAGDIISVYAGPSPEEPVVFKDWITGCDNRRDCSAVALGATQGDGAFDHLEILIKKPLAYYDDPSVSIKVPPGTDSPERAAVYIDGARIWLPPLTDGRFIIKGPPARALLRTMLTGAWAVLRGTDGGEVARTSLAGVKAALLRIDEQQGYSDTPRALVRQGKRMSYEDPPGYRVSITRPARSDRPATSPSATAMAELEGGDRCAIDVNRRKTMQRFRLDDSTTMLIVPWQCGNGAYNLYSNIMLVSEAGAVHPAVFDFDNGITGDGPSNVLVNVSWDDDKRVLEGFVRNRGIGDCGRVDRYVWGGEKFMLSEQYVMPECRMAFDRIRTWKVDVVDR